jgi:hypothetical protein
MDDPSTDAGASGNDNRGGTGTLGATIVPTDSFGDAETTFEVTAYPGDNFRICASCSDDYNNGLQVSETNLVDADGNFLPTSFAQVTPLLTVWRKLHVEIDRMATVTGNQVIGTIDSARYNSRKDETKLILNLPGGLTRLESKRFVGGEILIDSMPYPILGQKGRNTVTVGGNAQGTGGKSYTLVDDDDYNKNDTVQLKGDEGQAIIPPAETLSLFQQTNDPSKNVFAAAYIEPVYDGGGGPHNGTVPFLLNLPDDSAVKSKYVNDYRGSKGNESDNFWVAYVVFAYQFANREDNDPQGERTVTGGISDSFGRADDLSAGVPRGGNGSIIFLETLRDGDADPRSKWNPPTGEKLWFTKGTIPHEVGHQFGLKGDDRKNQFGIMSYLVRQQDLKFFPKHINILRSRVKSPGQP